MAVSADLAIASVVASEAIDREIVSPDVIDEAGSAARSNPEFAVLAVVGLLALVAGSWFLYRWLTRPPGVRLAHRLDKVDDVSILMHPNPDPDAMASAVGIAHLAEERGVSAKLYYPGQIRHQENRAFRTVLELDVEQIERASAMTDNVVLVDHGQPRGLPDGEQIDPIAVIDHHPEDPVDAPFVDVRPEYGACASIVAEYFQSLGAVPEGPDETIEDAELTIPSRVATGLVYGIQSDTATLTRGCSKADFDAYAYLFPGVDPDSLDRIANPQVDREVLEVKAQAFTDHEVRGSFAVCDVGELSNVDAIPQAADELLRREGISAVVVLGCRNGTLHMSGRSRDDRVHMGESLSTAVEPIPMASAGGHARMGGGQISTDHLNGLGPSDGVSRAELHDRIFDALTGEV